MRRGSCCTFLTAINRPRDYPTDSVMPRAILPSVLNTFFEKVRDPGKMSLAARGQRYGLMVSTPLRSLRVARRLIWILPFCAQQSWHMQDTFAAQCVALHAQVIRELVPPHVPIRFGI